MGTDHVLLTRFNLPSVGVENLIRVREGWLRKRVELFDRYCAPSVEAQGREDVHWIVYFDPASPAWLTEWMRPYVDRGLFRALFREAVPREDLVVDLADCVEDKHDLLITTNLDNDDALAVDFAERLAALRMRGDRSALYLRTGLIKSPQGLYLRTDRRNAFCSVVESWDAPVTCWAEYHNRLPNLMPSIEVGGAPGWLQVVHGDNVSNRVRGRLVSPRAYHSAFPGMLDDVPEPSRRDLSADLLLRPARFTRDTARAAARVTALRILGKERFSKAKSVVRSARSRRPARASR
jgi:hypothetical protein